MPAASPRQAGSSAAAPDRQPKGVRAGGASEDAPPRPLDPEAGADGCGRGLRRRLQTHPGAGRRSGVRGIGRVQRSEGRAGCHRTDRVRADARAPDRQRFPKSFPEINVRMVLVGPQREPGRRPCRHGRARRRVAGQQHDRDTGGFDPRVVCGSPGTSRPMARRRRRPISPISPASPSPAWHRGRLGRSITWRSLAQAPPPRCRLNVNTAEAAIDAAIAGVGITHVLSYQVARAVADGKAADRPPRIRGRSHAGQPLHAGRDSCRSSCGGSSTSPGRA